MSEAVNHAEVIRKALDAFVECECLYGAEFQHTCPRHGAHQALTAILIDREEVRTSLWEANNQRMKMILHAQAQAERIATLEEEMRRYLPVIEAMESDPISWGILTQGTGIATANGYRTALSTS